MRPTFALALAVYLWLLSSPNVWSQKSSFNSDSAYAYLEHLAVEIGPRPMGSRHEQEALRWATAKFRSFGADTAYVMPMAETSRGRNTQSGVAVGLFKGVSDSTIVIGGHIDTSAPEVPGANDDASGVACVIELARNWSQRTRHYTLLFAAFGGEEQGLLGSQHFVDHYPHLEDIALMLQIDMAGSAAPFYPFFDLKSHQSPAWLVEDAFTLDRALGFDDLEYPTRFFSLASVLPMVGSDHIPFQREGIPAIDFTAGVGTSPIHTPRDRIEFVDRSALSRSGRLVDGLLSRYQQQGIPPERKGHYMLWEVLGGRLYIPAWLIIAFIVVAIGLAAAAFGKARKQRLHIEPEERARFSGLKLVAILLLIAVFTQLGEGTMQFLKGLRYPWAAPVQEYLWFAAIWAVAGVWVGLQFTRRWRFSPDPYVYSKRAIILLLLMTLLFVWGSPRLGLYPALSLFFLSLAIFAPAGPVRLILSLLALWPMFRLMFMETFPFVARGSMASGFQIDTFWAALIYTAILTALLVVWYLPGIYTLGFAVVSVPGARKLARLVRAPAAGLVLLVVIIGYGGYLYGLPAYTERWRASLEARAEYDLKTRESSFELVGNEYFRNVTLSTDTLTINYDARIHRAEVPLKFRADWFTATGSESLSTDDSSVVHVDWQFITRRPWYRVKATLKTDTLNIANVTSDLAYRQDRDDATLEWLFEPPDTLRLRAELELPPGARLIRDVSAIYPEPPTPVNLTAELADIKFRTTVTLRDTLMSPVRRMTDRAPQ